VRVVESLRKRVFNAVKNITGLSAKITIVEPGSLPRSEGKIKRVIDNRKRG
jgi:phenylacetate-CoA ligase